MELTQKPENPKSTQFENVIFIGEKPLGNYVKSIMILVKKLNPSEIVIRSRGKFISKAVDIYEISKRDFLERNAFKLKEIKTATESFDKEGRKTSVSVMDIVLSK